MFFRNKYLNFQADRKDTLKPGPESTQRVEIILKKYTNNFKIIKINEIPIKPSSQKINYKKLLELAKHSHF